LLKDVKEKLTEKEKEKLEIEIERLSLKAEKVKIKVYKLDNHYERLSMDMEKNNWNHKNFLKWEKEVKIVEKDLDMLVGDFDHLMSILNK